MKKIIAFSIGLFSVTAIFAQSRDHHDRVGDYNNSREVVVGGGYDSHNKGYNSNNVYNYPSQKNNNVYNYPSQRNDSRYDEQRRGEERDRINHDYDRRIDQYRADRSINSYERDRRINQAERERNEKLKSFAGGAVVGAIAGVILGTILSH